MSTIITHDGTQIYYWANLVQQFVGVDVQTEPSLRLGNTTRLPVEGLFNATIVARNYDVTPDGRQLVVVTRADVRPADATAPAPRVNVVLNWLDDLKSRVAAR